MGLTVCVLVMEALVIVREGEEDLAVGERAAVVLDAWVFASARGVGDFTELCFWEITTPAITPATTTTTRTTPSAQNIQSVTPQTVLRSSYFPYATSHWRSEYSLPLSAV